MGRAQASTGPPPASAATHERTNQRHDLHSPGYRTHIGRFLQVHICSFLAVAWHSCDHKTPEWEWPGFQAVGGGSGGTGSHAHINPSNECKTIGRPLPAGDTSQATSTSLQVTPAKQPQPAHRWRQCKTSAQTLLPDFHSGFGASGAHTPRVGGGNSWQSRINVIVEWR